MRKSTLRVSLSLLALSCQIGNAFSQFTINESFRNSTVSNNIVLSGGASLTSGQADPVGQGWLQLTNAQNNQAGSAIVQQSFPSAMGVLFDFEYKTWSPPGSGNGADGIAFFLFDADSISAFRSGGYGGSLGYAQRTGIGGIPGGYMGLGLDEFGNYSNPTEGRIGGIGFIKNAVALRGPAPNYAYIAGNQVIPSDTGSGDNGGIDYNSTTTTRPTNAQFYRRVQVLLQSNNGLYTVTVKWKKDTNDSFSTLFGPVTMTTPPPANLMLGISAATGACHNYHEIRNLHITTPGNVSVTITGPGSIPTAPTPADLGYDVTIQNLTTVRLTDIQLQQLLPPNYNINTSAITINNYGNAADSISNIDLNGNALSAVASLASNAEITLHLPGHLSGFQLGQTYTSSVKVNAPSIQDVDTTNNYDTAYTIVQTPLPIKLNYFTAFKQQDNVKLSWETASEIDNDHFDVERSTDGKTFNAIGTVKGKHSTNLVSDYQFNDADAQNTGARLLFYRLLQADINGTINYSDVKTVLMDDKGMTGNVSAFPVPFSDNLTLRLNDATAGSLLVNGYTATGKLLFHQNYTITSGTNLIPLNQLQSLPGGVYTIQCITSDLNSSIQVTKQ